MKLYSADSASCSSCLEAFCVVPSPMVVLYRLTGLSRFLSSCIPDSAFSCGILLKVFRANAVSPGTWR